MHVCLKTARDSRRMHSPLHVQSCPSLIVHDAKHNLRSDCCRMASHKAYNHRRTVRFDTNNNSNNNNNNDDEQRFNDDKERVCNGQSGVGMCKSGFGGSGVVI